MKNNLQKSILAILMVFSLSCLIFLNSLSVNAKTVDNSAKIEEAKQEVMLPDVKVIKAIIEKGKQVLPAS